jgi:hypothetical protein
MNMYTYTLYSVCATLCMHACVHSMRSTLDVYKQYRCVRMNNTAVFVSVLSECSMCTLKVNIAIYLYTVLCTCYTVYVTLRICTCYMLLHTTRCYTIHTLMKYSL